MNNHAPLRSVQTNEIPAKTWYFLELNSKPLPCPSVLSEIYPEVSEVKDFTVFTETPQAIPTVHPFSSTGVSREYTAYLQEFPSLPLHYQTSPGTKQGLLKLTAPLCAESDSFCVSTFHALPHTDSTVILDITSDAPQCTGAKRKDLNEPAFLAMHSVFQVDRCASMTVILIHRGGDEATIIDDISAKVHKEGSFHLIHLILGGKENIVGSHVDLEGTESRLISHMGYLTKGCEKLDIQYSVPQRGRRTSSDIHVLGTMRDSSEKAFKGTIDFLRGASGSTGSEKEDVLLLSDGVKNKSLPVILCGEENVEGAHGATIGKLSGPALYYMESRGLSEAKACEVLSRARLSSVCSLIDHEPTRQEISTYIETLPLSAFSSSKD